MPTSTRGVTMVAAGSAAAGPDGLRVVYDSLPDGARIKFSTDDPILVTAVHRWFGAQLSDHGADATYR
jgi:hypothetical protein